MLHLIAHSLAHSPVLARISTGDSVLFLENAVYDLHQNTPLAVTLRDLGTRSELYALAPDLRLRGIDPNALVSGIRCIEDTGFVELTLRHRIIKTWH